LRSNYRAACRARSKPEFVAKIGIVEEEADESAFWMQLIIEGKLLGQQLVQPLLEETSELEKIMASSRKSAAESLKAKANGKLAIGNQKSAMTHG
jgi:four helix bundle protein